MQKRTFVPGTGTNFMPSVFTNAAAFAVEAGSIGFAAGATRTRAGVVFLARGRKSEAAAALTTTAPARLAMSGIFDFAAATGPGAVGGAGGRGGATTGGGGGGITRGTGTAGRGARAARTSVFISTVLW